MKIKIICILITITTFCNAQIVSIPNANFKAKLLSANVNNEIAKDLNGSYFDIDANNDNEIQVSEALQVKEINLLNSINISSIEGINSFTNLTRFEHSSNYISTVGLTSVDVTSLNQINYLEIQCSNLNLGQKNNLETIIIPKTTLLNYSSATPTLKYFKGILSTFTSIDYLKRLLLEDITFVYFQVFSVPYEVLKYHSNLKNLKLIVGNEVNNEFGSLDFTTYNTLDNALYPQNVKKLVVKNLTQFFPVQNFASLEDLTFYSVGAADCLNCIIFNPSNFPNLKYLSFFRRNSNPITTLDLSMLSNLKVFKTDSYTNPLTQETLINVNFGVNSNLEEVYLKANPFSTIDFTQNPNLKIIDLVTNYNDANQTGTVSPNNITLHLATNNLLETFKTRGYITNLNNPPSIANFTITNLDQSSQLKEVFFHASNFVTPLSISSAYFTRFEASYSCYFNALNFNTPNFSYFSLNFDAIPSLQPANLTDLSLDFSSVQNPLFLIQNLNYTTLRFVSLKNGLVNQQDLEINNDDQGLTLCVDAIEQVASNFPNGWYWWQIPQNTIITNTCTLQTENIETETSITIYPNPTSDFVYFNSLLPVSKIELYDISGRIIISQSISDNKINISDLESGNYILKLYTEKEILNSVIIKK